MSLINHITGKPYSNKALAILDVRKSLPAWKHKAEIIETVRKNQVTVLVGETGSGKTTQTAQFLLEPNAGIVGDGRMIACTQPRRVAAMSVAARVADEMDVRLGDEVGYCIRFEDLSSPKTILKFLTDGMLLRETILDPQLKRYSVIMLDEAHERTISTDILFGLLKRIVKDRPDLKIVIMSATLDSQKFQNFFGEAPLISIAGRTFPVTVLYSTRPEANYLEAAIRTAVQIHEHEDAGDILLFLTGEEEIEQACSEIQEKCELLPDAGPVLVVPLYSTLPPAMQQRIFLPAPTNRKQGGRPGRKIVISTNIAETSITIDGIVYVVDPGFSKQKLYNPRTRMDALQVLPVSQASANQRKGRAGRTRPGKCFRLYTEDTFQALNEQSAPEMLLSNMMSVALHLFKVGVYDIVHFDYIDPPAPETLMRALEDLHQIGALDDEGDLTSMGQCMAELPLEPQMSKLILRGAELGVKDQCTSIAALLSGPPPFVRPRTNPKEADRQKDLFAHQSGDHLTLLNVYNAFTDADDILKFCKMNFFNPRTLQNAQRIKNQLDNMLTAFERRGDINVKVDCGKNLRDESELTRVKRALVSAYFTHLAYKAQEKQCYKTLEDHYLTQKHPSSVLTNMPSYLLFHESVMTKQKFLRTITSFESLDMMFDEAPHYFDFDNDERFPPREEITKEIKKKYEQWMIMKNKMSS